MSEADDTSLRPWTRTASEKQGAYRVFDVRADRVRVPRTGEEHTFYVIEAPDWVNVIPVTPDGRMVFVRQWRQGSETVSLEVPGGVMDPGEDAETAARRELREETGYEADRFVDLGSVAPNPALQNNRCHVYLAPGARRTTAPAPDATEELEVVLVDPATVPGRIRRGEIAHALVVAAFYLYDAWRAETGGAVE